MTVRRGALEVMKTLNFETWSYGRHSRSRLQKPSLNFLNHKISKMTTNSGIHLRRRMPTCSYYFKQSVENHLRVRSRAVEKWEQCKRPSFNQVRNNSGQKPMPPVFVTMGTLSLNHFTTTCTRKLSDHGNKYLSAAIHWFISALSKCRTLKPSTDSDRV